MRSLLFCVTLLAGVAVAATPPTRRPSDMERGKELYERHCMACHGAQAKGDGPATEALVAEVPDLANQVKEDDATIDVVLFGSGPMPSFQPSFDRADARRVVKYMGQAHIKGKAEAVQDDATPEPEDEPLDDAQAPDDETPDDDQRR